mmetsp:Transcript_9230/g.27791  ORF Transcript_9230/g.27791 Transcript_9230/m.27791 type:complete len:223 (+) Transcript_9230:193-861(+)
MSLPALPRSTLRNALKLYNRFVWASPGYMTYLPPRQKWRIPPPEIGGKDDRERPGSSLFFFPPSKVKKRAFTVKGPLGQLKQPIPWTALDVVQVPRTQESFELQCYADNGTRSFVANAISGVHDGYAVILELVGVGYRVEAKEDCIHMRVGYNHPVRLPYEKDGVLLKVIQPTRLQVAGVDKAKVHQAAAMIRKHRPPEPYKGKGVRYEDETIRLKAGKKNE